MQHTPPAEPLNLKAHIEGDGNVHVFTENLETKDITSWSVLKLVQDLIAVQCKFSEGQRDEALLAFIGLKVKLQESVNLLETNIALFKGDLDVLPPVSLQDATKGK